MAENETQSIDENKDSKTKEKRKIQLKDFTHIHNPQDVEICWEFQKKIYDRQHSIVTINGESNDKEPITIFKDFNNAYWTQGYVGVICDDNNQIEIGSRFDNGSNQFFLQCVFSEALDVRANIFDDMEVTGDIEKTLDILLLFTFIKQLRKALKKGKYRKYREFYYNDSKVKGQIDVDRHVRLNKCLSNGKVAYHTREYTANNMVNVLILNAYNMMLKKHTKVVRNLLRKDRDLLNQIELLKQENPGWDCYGTSKILKETNKKIVNSVYHDYEALRKTSIIIVKRLGINSYAKDKSKVSGLLIDMPKLWEDFLGKTVFKDTDFEAQHGFSIIDEHRTIKPDFFYREKNEKNEKIKIVIDAKYKNNWGETVTVEEKDTWGDNTREDVFQIMAYMLALKCDTGGVIFPYKSAGEEKPGIEEYCINDINQDKKFLRIPFIIPSESEYKDYSFFEGQMKNQIVTIRETLQKYYR